MAKNCLPELLAPAGSLDALKAAVNAGADAVYISGKNYGARKFATNFSESQIEEGLKYAKLRGVKVYVTVNTLINDSNILYVAGYLKWLYKVGVDAVIIQDLGIACLSRNVVPNLNIHASTQMTIHNTWGVEWAKEFGFKRVVLSRELGISEVKDIKRNAGNKIEIEIFGHGALCYSYSGQCLLSSFIGGRSGNKGMCAQPCRKKYNLLAGKVDQYGRPNNYHLIDLNEKYLLSTRDLAVYENLAIVVGTNIDSLKIEGRMRSAEYVGMVVKIYREALNCISEGKWKPDAEDISKLKLAFNRGFTGGYLTENHGNSVMGHETPGNQGLYIGKVQHITENTGVIVVNVENKFKLKKGDGIAFVPYNKLSETYGMALESNPIYKGNKLLLKVGKHVNLGTKLYLTRSKSFNQEANRILNNISQLSILIDVKMSWTDDRKAYLCGKFIGFDGLEHTVHLKSDYVMEKAIRRPLKIEQIEDQLQKTGQTPFKLRKVSIKYSGDLFSPISKLNHFRRKFLEKAELQLLKSYKPSKLMVQETEQRFNKIKKSFNKIEQIEETLHHNPVLAVYADSIDCVKGALDGGAKRVYFEPNPMINCQNTCNSCSQNLEISSEMVNAQEEFKEISSLLDDAKKLCDLHDVEFIWKWPQITHQHQINNYCKVLNSHLQHGLKEVMVDGLGAALGIKNVIPDINLSGSAGLNIWNRYSILMLSKIFNTVTPSAELSVKELKGVISSSRLSGIQTRYELVVQGNVDTVISKDCLLSIAPKREIENPENQFWGIQDEKRHIFPIKIDSEGHTHILNSVELCLVDHLPKITKIGVDIVVVDLRNKTYDYAMKMTSIYAKGLEYIEMDVNTAKKFNQLKSEIKLISTGGITTGNFLTGVKDKQ